MKLLVDVFNTYARARFAMQDLSHGGMPTGGLYGFVRTVDGIARSFDIDPVDVYLCPEAGGSDVRKALYADYKAGRRKDSLWHPGDYERLVQWCEFYGATWAFAPYREADDLIAHIATESIHDDVIICSRDHDFYALLTGSLSDNERSVSMWDGPKNCFMDAVTFYEKHGYEPHLHKMVGYLAGDPSDNVPAAFNRCGKGTALKILRECDWDMAKVFEHPKVKPHTEAVIRNTLLINWHEVEDYYAARAPRDPDLLDDWYRAFGFRSMIGAKA